MQSKNVHLWCERFVKIYDNIFQAFMYVSTAYTHAYRDLVDETFYNVVYDEDEIATICTELDETQIGSLTPK